MPDYRLYFLSANDHFVRAADVRAPDDQAALAIARDLRHIHGIEVWCGKRKVGVVEPAR